MRDVIRQRGESPRAAQRAHLLVCYPPGLASGLTTAQGGGKLPQSWQDTAMAEGLRAFAGLQARTGPHPPEGHMPPVRAALPTPAGAVVFFYFCLRLLSHGVSFGRIVLLAAAPV